MKDKYKWFFDQSPFMIVILDEHGIVKNINQKVFDWLGYSPDTFIGERFISLKELSGEIEEPLNEKSKTPIEISFLSSDKTIKKGQIFSIATPDKNTTILYIQNDTFFKKEENVAGFQYRRALLSLFNSPANTIVILNRKFKIVRINDHTLNLLERDRVDILGRDIFSFVKIEKSQLSKIISSQESILQYETFVYAGKRKQIPVLIKISKLLQNDEVFIVLDIFNISDRIAMERELRENKEKFRQLTENNDEAFWISTAEDIEHIAYVSPAFEHIWGISPEKLYKHPYVWKKSIYHEDKDFVEAELHSFSKYQKKLNIKYRILHKDGTIRWVWNKGFLIQSTPGAKPCFAGIIQDITLQRYTEEALRESSKKYKSLFELVSDSLLIVHEQTLQIIDANMAACNMFSYEYGDLLGEKITKLTREKRKIKQILKASSAKHSEVLFIGKNNRVFPVEFSKNPISIENQEYFLCSLRDISDRKENEKRMLNAVITAEENERKRIAENIHDDIGPFLSGIMMYVREIISPNTKQKQKEYLIDYLNDMLDKTIEKTRNISHNLMPTILTDFGIIKAVNDFCNQINKLNQVKIVFRHSNNFRIDEIYEISIYRIITELVNNSLKHSNAKNIFIDIKKTKTKITINFRDDGIGFALNQRIKKTTGLGLRNVLSRLDSIHGTYSFKSKKNEGIQFYFTINLKETI